MCVSSKSGNKIKEENKIRGGINMWIGIKKDEKKNSITEIDKLPFYYSLLLLSYMPHSYFYMRRRKKFMWRKGISCWNIMGSKESFFRSKYIHARTMKLYASANRKGKRQMKKFSFVFYIYFSQHNPKYELLCYWKNGGEFMCVWWGKEWDEE
jgi:hypothetical protein